MGWFLKEGHFKLGGVMGEGGYAPRERGAVHLLRKKVMFLKGEGDQSQHFQKGVRGTLKPNIVF